jgi:hypothetical protein
MILIFIIIVLDSLSCRIYCGEETEKNARHTKVPSMQHCSAVCYALNKKNY